VLCIWRCHHISNTTPGDSRPSAKIGAAVPEEHDVAMDDVVLVQRAGLPSDGRQVLNVDIN